VNSCYRPVVYTYKVKYSIIYTGEEVEVGEGGRERGGGEEGGGVRVGRGRKKWRHL